MKRRTLLLSAFIGLTMLCCRSGGAGFPLSGDYLGQTPPGPVPRVFAPGVVSTGLDELNAVFSPDGREFYFCVRNFSGAVSVFRMKRAGAVWSRPELLPFASRFGDIDVTISPDGNTLLFSSRRPMPGSDQPKADYDFWKSRRLGETWSRAEHLGNGVNSDAHDFYPMMTQSGTIYFSSQREGTGTNNIYRSIPVDGTYPEAEKLSPAVNTEYREFDPYVSPDETFIIFTSSRPEGYGSGDLYISFRDEAGCWREARNMGEPINTPGAEYCAMVSPDGCYLFFTSARREPPSLPDRPARHRDFMKMHNDPKNRFSDIYWVDATIIDSFR